MLHLKFPAVWPSRLSSTSKISDSHPHRDKIALGKVKESPPGTSFSYIDTYHYNHSPKTVTYEVVVNCFKTLHLTVDFEGTMNMALFPSPEFSATSKGMKINAVIRPFQRVYLGYLQVVDIYEKTHIEINHSSKFEEADARGVEECGISEFDQTLQTEIQLIHDHQINLYSLEQDPMSKHFLGEIVAANAKFVDFDFMPNDQSLYPPMDSKKKSSESDKKSWVAKWKRPAQFMRDPSNIRVFQGSISANDIKQGQLGDCWFLSTVATLTEFPNLIKEMFQDDFIQQGSTEDRENAGVSTVGLYHLRFYKGGIETIVRVDDYFPCGSGPNMPDCYGPLFSKSNGDELWVMLVEKAFAKIHGSYIAIEAGQPHEALMDLTGAPTKYITFDDIRSDKKVSNATECEWFKFQITVDFIFRIPSGGSWKYMTKRSIC
jgi:hypothetical protein